MMIASRPVALLAAILSGLLLSFPIVAQDQTGTDGDDALRSLLDGALAVHINARIIDQDQNETVWNMNVTRVTISGRSVTIRLDGSNVAVVAEFTPYWEDDGQLMLVAQGWTWLTDGENAGAPEYRTSFSTVPIQLGEPIVFLPLGTGQVPVDTERFGRLNIELEINVERYQS